MIIKERVYIATFTVEYDDYMDSIQKGFIVRGAKLNSNREFVFKKSFTAFTRKKAVDKVCQWYWKELKGLWGQAHTILTVSDDYQEVYYSDNFSCADKGNRYLDESTILLLLKDSNGELLREESVGEKHHPTNSVKRAKRRRIYLQQVADNIYQHPNTKVMYYAQTVVPQKTKNGKVVQKRKRENFKLVAKSLDKAYKEIERRFGESPQEANDSPNP